MATEEQQQILQEYIKTVNNIIISALAGCGKSYILLEIFIYYYNYI